MRTKAKSKRIGRPKVAPTPGQRVSLGLRVTAEIKNRLDRAAERAGRSQSQEAELRLERSFTDADALGGPEIQNMARLMAAAFLHGGQRGAAASGHPEWTPAEWMREPFCYRAAMAMAVEALTTAQPVAYESGHPDAEQRALHTKIHDVMAAFAGRGSAVQYTKGKKEK